MITIQINQKPENLENIGYMNREYSLNTTIQINDNATISECLLAFVQAMKIEGFKLTDENMTDAIDDLVADGEIEIQKYSSNRA